MKVRWNYDFFCLKPDQIYVFDTIETHVRIKDFKVRGIGN